MSSLVNAPSRIRPFIGANLMPLNTWFTGGVTCCLLCPIISIGLEMCQLSEQYPRPGGREIRVGTVLVLGMVSCSACNPGRSSSLPFPGHPKSRGPGNGQGAVCRSLHLKSWSHHLLAENCQHR